MNSFLASFCMAPRINRLSFHLQSKLHLNRIAFTFAIVAEIWNSIRSNSEPQIFKHFAVIYSDACVMLTALIINRDTSDFLRK